MYRLGLPSALFLVGLCLVHCSREPQTKAKTTPEMVLIPAGEFLMGGEKADLEGFAKSNYLNYEAEYPRHQVKLSAYYLDKYEVTNAQYQEFLAYLEQHQDTSMNHPGQPADQDHLQHYINEQMTADNQPATGLNWFDAYAYCKWVGKRLPTEAEWEYAARGPTEAYRRYPWGNEAVNEDGIWRANIRPEQGWGADGFRYTAPVGSFPDGVSPFGIMDMAGNAEEWVYDWLDASYYRNSQGAQDPQGPADGHNKVIKGGSFGTDPIHIRIATKLYGAPEVKSEMQGCRCAKDS
ncbi:MAG: SUMF1/EgtB/PvdO family nonheme iron enzyme [Candidatus Latescibacteria bacterium]|nr:SUMF1/EgtB/PvdO family nonheme iron enzyme [Candidatus Latescibacterota bacterium]